MKTAKLLLAFCLLVIVTGGVYYVGFSSHKKNYRFEELVPADAILLYESTDPIHAWNQLVDQPIWARLSEIESLKKLESQLVSLDSLLGGGGQLDRSLKGSQLGLSLHAVGREDLGVLFGLAFKNTSDREKFLSNLEDSFLENITKNSRAYSGVRIFEHRLEEDRTISLAFINNTLVASYTSFLVEDAIRRARSSEQKSFKEEFSELYDSKATADGAGLLRLGTPGLARLIQAVNRDGSMDVVEVFQKNKMSANLNVSFSDGAINLHGLSLYQDGNKVKFPRLEGNRQHVFGAITPNRTALFTQYKVNDPRQIHDISNKAFDAKSTLAGDIDKSFSKEQFFQNLTGEVAFLHMEETGVGSGDKILLLKTKEMPVQLQHLKDFSATNSVSSVYDYHRNKEIFAIRDEEFPAHLFEGQFIGFPNTFVTFHEDVLVWGNNIQAVRRFLDDLENDNTWGKTLSQKRIMEAVDKSYGYNFVANVQRVWNGLLHHASPSWSSTLQKFAPQIKAFDVLSVKLEDKGKNQDIQIQLGYGLAPVRASKDIFLEENLSVTFNADLTYGPKVQRNFTDGNVEFLVQDEWDRVHLVTHDGDLVFSQRIDGPIKTEIFQMDYYKNGKLQMVFATERYIYGLDRLGNPLPNFPFELPNAQAIQFVNLLDYENTRDYRIFASSTSGGLYLFDKHGEILDGWSPRNTSGPLSSKPAHHTIPAMGDFMVALNQNGQLHMFNRKGESQFGEPLQLGSGVNTNYVLQQRGRTSESQLVTVTDEGEVIRVNFKGEFTDRKQLLRPDRSSSFHLVKDQAADRYLFVVHDYNKVTVMDTETNVLFEKNLSSPELKFQLFSFGGDKNIFVVIDGNQEFIYLYNLKGELLNTKPLSGGSPVDIRFSSSRNEYRIYNIHEKTFFEFRMPY
ncbi:hypothetical protein KI659_01190 [Litoribacter alkaliphilus]|uniref:WD40 repeat domain-containing protein n=1 Tax=Litoribacter ruber TaxID=702568 RepID=A0AAP2CE30_9BACT|nr:hypothetical protein [Litoribacter alkaliphilus]MBS9522616.1 hypothetical protein [Litoribacter alkaliphilus]